MSTQRNALVTGASRGIGAAIAQRLLNDGLFVIGTATTADGADQISKKLGEGGLGLQLQIQDQDSIQSALDEVSSTKRSIDVLVNNAGITRDNIFVRMSNSAWDDVVETNLTGLFRVTKPLVRTMMRNRWGRIVNIGSVVGTTGNPGQVNYSAAKAGIEGFTRSLALEVASRGITVNCVAPGMIATDMTADLPETVASDLLSRIPLGRLGQTADVACAVSFLASDEASYITAQTIHVNGGMLAT